jgi:hypothetical protein
MPPRSIENRRGDRHRIAWNSAGKKSSSQERNSEVIAMVDVVTDFMLAMVDVVTEFMPMFATWPR